uniref:Uncharacterized protein n=1 Tax=Oryza sativa subsp. japonica TaxID=39947 RepID=Q8L674_ORYSJ|nr:hypothetical protein [Oryza sativa Japonica Group]
MGGRCVGAAVKCGEGAAGGAEEGVGDSGWRCALPDLAARPSLAAPRQAFGRRRRQRRTRWVAMRDMKAAAGSNVSAGTALSVVALAAAADWIHIADCRPVDRFPLPSRPSLPPASRAPRHPHEVRKAVVSEALPLECPPLSLPRPSPPSVVRPSAPQSAARPSTPPGN